MQAKEKIINWLCFAALSIIWGSSFILMKAGMTALSPYQVASIRILSAGLVLLPAAITRWKEVPFDQLRLVVLSGLLGSFFPAYLFCIAETRIDSSLAGILNALTPLSAILLGVFFFQLPVTPRKVAGVIIGFIGLCLLFLAKGKISFNDISYASLVLLATVFYGINVNMVGRHLKGVPSVTIAALAFSSLIIPSLLVLALTGFFQLPLTDSSVQWSTAASVLLGVMGTAIASIIFYVLVKRAGTVFSSLVTYGIPFVAVAWGLIYGETINLLQVACLGIILAGVFMVNKK
ncbi:DMT family transporter [Flavihumibacter rivuli]|uniref:DMT family transporter n=1 Tax=Flavihumibacter rivuli TaxID=2838156 RepID=UPI001BDE9B48|nr:DMT family transporter [Flavihumibacter rivuli]ULQ55033.1 DMT family transporter [Flavihumibacter rivuli]